MPLTDRKTEAEVQRHISNWLKGKFSARASPVLVYIM